MKECISCIPFGKLFNQSALMQKVKSALLLCSGNFKGVFTTLAVSLSCLFMVACSDDSKHQDVPPAVSLDVYSQGTITTSIPAMPVFTPVQTSDYVKVSWTDATRSVATVEVGAFDIDVAMMGRTISIGAIKVSDVACSTQADGSIAFAKENFVCQAGDYEVKGNISGVYREGKLTVTLKYHPGSMPFECHSDYESQSVS